VRSLSQASGSAHCRRCRVGPPPACSLRRRLRDDRAGNRPADMLARSPRVAL